MDTQKYIPCDLPALRRVQYSNPGFGGGTFLFLLVKSYKVGPGSSYKWSYEAPTNGRNLADFTPVNEVMGP